VGSGIESDLTLGKAISKGVIMNQAKAVSLLNHELLLTIIIATAISGMGMRPVLAQQAQPTPSAVNQPPALPPPPPDMGAAQMSSTRGTVSKYLMNPDGLVDGLLLSDNTVVRFPPHLGQQLVQNVRPQDSVRVDGFFEFQGVIHASTITKC
jgi:hypothetical protein